MLKEGTMGFETLKFAGEEVAALKKENRFLQPRVLESAQEPVSVIDGKKVVNLTSNNYLALANDPKVKRAAIEAIEKYGVGSAAVRTIIGTMSIHKELEEKFAAFKHAEASILFQSGFTSNVAVCQSLMSSEQDLLISDELNHASIIDGARLYGISGREIFATWYRMENLLKSGAVDIRPAVTHTLPFADYRKAFTMINSREKKCGKVILKP